jgi:lysyl-tRNA synthetase class 2
VPGGKLLRTERVSYQEAVQRTLRLNPFWASIEELMVAVKDAGVPLPEGDRPRDRDYWLDLLMGAVVGPQLGRDGLCFLYDYPASQAALARVRAGNPPVAERFELYWQGIELANGFHELADAAEQKRRFEADQQRRSEQGKTVPPADERLIDALRTGLPDCSGVALGIDRLLMLILGLESVGEAMPFAMDRA